MALWPNKRSIFASRFSPLGLRWAKSRESYRRIAGESYRCDSNHCVRWQSYLSPCDWRSLAQHTFHVALRNGLRELTAFAEHWRLATGDFALLRKAPAKEQRRHQSEKQGCNGKSQAICQISCSHLRAEYPQQEASITGCEHCWPEMPQKTPRMIILHDILSLQKEALPASRDMVISNQICCSNLQRVFHITIAANLLQKIFQTF